MDESPKQMIKETKIPIPMKSGSDAKVDFEYERCGVANIFIASGPLKGKRYVEVRVVSSFISIEQAEQNFKHEFSGFKCLEDTKKAAAELNIKRQKTDFRFFVSFM